MSSSEIAPTTSFPVTVNKDVLEHLTHQQGDSMNRVRAEFPLVENVNLIYTNIPDQKTLNYIWHDVAYTLLWYKNRLPRSQQVQADYNLARVLCYAELLRALGPKRERELVNTTIGEVRNLTTDEKKKPSGRGLLHSLGVG